MICRAPRHIHKNPTGSVSLLDSRQDTGYFGRTLGSTSPNSLRQVVCQGRAACTSDISDTYQNQIL